MKTRNLHGPGTVLKYPYVWRGSVGTPEPKLRTACLMFTKALATGNTAIVIVSISDMPGPAPEFCIAVPPHEIERGGLSAFRNAFVHLDQYNVDQVENSFHYNPAAPVMGQLSGQFVAKLAKTLAHAVRIGRAERIDRK
jgi:hypothetical protein